MEHVDWMKDTLKYDALDAIHRRCNHQLITFSFVHAWSENYSLPISHDEAVHGKRSLLAEQEHPCSQRLNLPPLGAMFFAAAGSR
jgi:1,4-alpha-glucan branching enzyme